MSAVLCEGARQPVHVPADVEGGLIGKPQRRTVDEDLPGANRLLRLHPGETGATQRPRLLLEKLPFNRRGGDQQTVEPLEVAIDVLGLDDRLDAVNGGGVTGYCQAHAFGAEQLFETAEVVVEHRGQVRGGPAGLTGRE